MRHNLSFSCYAAHRPLHSFPTRRSSDLVTDASHITAAFPAAAKVIPPTDQTDGAGRVQVTRSEEHTSELQSRLHLVCRLLLEKKKILYSPTSCIITLGGCNLRSFTHRSF